MTRGLQRGTAAVFLTVGAVEAFEAVSVSAAVLAESVPPGAVNGTIIIGVHRPTFIVMAADRLWHGYGPGSSPITGTQQKYVLHQGRPLAIVHSGLATLPQNRYTNAVVQRVVEQLAAPEQLELGSLVGRFRAALGQPVQEARAELLTALRQQAAPPSLEAQIMGMSRVRLLIAFARDRLMYFGQLEVIGTQPQPHETKGEVLSAPDSLKTFYSMGKYKDDVFLFGRTISDAVALAHHLRAVVEDGIRAEARMYGGQNRQVGGGVDTILVDGNGARLVP
jgi:hypothetical protein